MEVTIVYMRSVVSLPGIVENVDNVVFGTASRWDDESELSLVSWSWRLC